MATCNEFHQLIPDDVIIDILLRLPVKSLIRARAVCKNWYTIIKNTSFVAKHFNRHTNSGRLFVHRHDKISEKYVFSLYPDQTLAGSSPVYQDLVVDMPDKLWVGACNGILCLSYHSRRFALWNPATREYRSLPEVPRKFPPNVTSFQETFGFGLDPITNDYKLVRIWNTADFIRGKMHGPYKVAVYTLSTDSWRHLDVDLPYTWIDTPQTSTCINGVYYWSVSENFNHYLILSFDMSNELFHDILDIPSSKPSSIVPYNNSLALIYIKEDKGGVDIWVMREEGGWTKQLTVELIRYPFGFWKNGKIITKIDERRVVLYDPETHEIKYLGSPNWANCLVYRESLVAIGGGDGLLAHNQLSDVDLIFNFSKTVLSSS
ncbi:putative F-box protein At5g52610 isoform X2 [Cornus florida]|uniref:putative F-box protein At5g52610 isoform X2 n=1 Tax=Cornus florida TaxID=4283 RepID=UPI002898C69F|nr:putative F-box protein At5g52610 isoform X2 [Cornus florida]